jgi:cytochrome P450
MASRTYPSNVPLSTPEYRFPPGLAHNLLWRVLKRMRPVDPIPFFRGLAERFGPAAHYKIGRQHVVFINDPEYVRQILVVQNDNFIKERVVQRSKLLLGEGMITAEGAEHRRQRLAAQPAFHRQTIPVYADTMVHLAAETRDCWSANQQLNIALEMMHLTLNVVAKTLFRTELGEEVREVAQAINDIMGLYHFMILLPAAESLVHFPLPGVLKFRRARRRLDALVYNMIEQHRSASDGEADLLTMMLRGSYGDAYRTDRSRDAQLRDEVITIFLAGYETVANALAWTWWLLSQHPEVEAKFHREIDTVLGSRRATYDDLPRLRYTEMVLAESMRLYPPAWAMGRCALRDFELGPYFLPAGTTVLMSQFVMHRSPQYFREPLTFDPDRFGPDARAGRSRSAYFPFGAGGRQCIGEAFAWMEGVLVLATIAQQWKLRSEDDRRIEPEPLITLRPRRGISMRVVPRN